MKFRIVKRKRRYHIQSKKWLFWSDYNFPYCKDFVEIESAIAYVDELIKDRDSGDQVVVWSECDESI